MRYTSSKDLNQLIKQLVKKGWIYQRRKKHAMLIAPDRKNRICIAISPSGRRVSNYVRTMANNCSN